MAADGKVHYNRTNDSILLVNICQYLKGLIWTFGHMFDVTKSPLNKDSYGPGSA